MAAPPSETKISEGSAAGVQPRPRRTLAVAGVTHALHDGYTDVIYILLPIWQAEFGLSYAMLGLLRSLYNGAMAALQIPAGRLAERFGGRFILALGTALAGAGYALAGFSGGLIGLAASLLIGGAGSSTQHPIASAAVSRAYGKYARGPLGVYNFTGDLGKAAMPALISVPLTFMPWRMSLWLLAVLGLTTAIAIMLLMPPLGRALSSESQPVKQGQGRGGFALLLSIGVLDSGVRMGFLIFLPFLLQAKGASLPMVGFALALVFLGGAAGKLVCGWLGGRIGVLPTVAMTEGGTAIGILAILGLPLSLALPVLPLVGIMLNGTSSVLYGTVPELAPPDRTERAFALFYTGTIGSGAVSPVIYGALADAAGTSWAVIATAVAALMTIPLAFVLAPHLVTDELDSTRWFRR